tara:strand:- start:207 stop:440 length:234 start_codon:yes stop_codon:yes gene_type:complete
MFKIEDRIIHDVSFAVSLDVVELITWRKNDDTGEYWVKFHLPSGKEIRIKVSESDLRDIVDEVYNGNYDLDFGWHDE